MTDYAGPYRGVRQRVRDLVADLDDAALRRVAPATPSWTVHDIVAHLTGITADIVAGNLGGVATDEWTARQVEARRDRSIRDVLDEWDEHGPVVEGMAGGFGDAAGQLVSDATTHEHDIRGALDRPGARESDAIAVAFEWAGRGLGGARGAAGVGALRIEHEAGASTFGGGEVEATVRCTRFELMRTVTGRRSLEQILAFPWQGDPRADLLVSGIFTPRPTSLVE